MAEWIVYILECSDGTLYTGITTDMTRRLGEHNEKKGARYTRGRTPVILRHKEAVPDRARALRREAAIKRMAHHEKRTLFMARNRKNVR